MKKKAKAGLIAIVAIALIVAFSGCIEEKTQESTTPEVPPEISTKLGGTITNVMKQVPDGSRYTLVYIDLKNVREDDGLTELMRSEIEVYDALADAGIPEVGISIDKVALYMDLLAERMSITCLIWGNFDLKRIRGYLEDGGWQQDTYREVEIWYRESGGSNEIALFKEEIIIGKKGDVKNIIKVMKGEKESLYDNKDTVDVVNKLSDGFRIQIGEQASYFDIPGAPCRSLGSSIKKISKDEIKVQAVYKFDDESKAEDYANRMEKYATRAADREITTQDEYVILTSIYKISELSRG